MDIEHNIRELRDQIDAIDDSILHLLSERFIATREIGRIKADGGMPAQSPNREAEQFDRLASLAKGLNVDPDLVQAIYRLLIDTVIDEHRDQKSS